MASVYFHGKSKLSFCLAILIEFVIATICIAADIQSINLTTTKLFNHSICSIGTMHSKKTKEHGKERAMVK